VNSVELDTRFLKKNQIEMAINKQKNARKEKAKHFLKIKEDKKKRFQSFEESGVQKKKKVALMSQEAQ